MAEVNNTTTKVRVQEHLYAEFKRRVRAFGVNKSGLKGKYIRKVYDVDQHIKDFVRVKGLAGAYNRSLFFPIEKKQSANIQEYMNRLFMNNAPRTAYYDSHRQAATWSFVRKDDYDPKSIMEIVNNQALAINEYYAYRTSCFNGVLPTIERAMADAENDDVVMCVEHKLADNISWTDAQYFIEQCKQAGAIPKDMDVLLDTDEENERCVASATLLCSEDVDEIDHKRFYFSLCFPRMLSEYAGSVNAANHLMREFGLNFWTAIILSFHYQSRQRWLHLPWSSHSQSLIPLSKALQIFAQRKLFGYPVRYFQTAETMTRIYDKVMFGLSTLIRDKKWDLGMTTLINQFVTGG